MSIEKLIVYVEEPSARDALNALLPKLLGTITFQIHDFSCKE